MLGTALGAGIAGMRPIVEVMYADFLLVAMDQIVNQIANAHYVSHGALRPRLTVRTQQGATPGSCAQHSQSLEALFAHIPGWRVGLPATPRDAYDMLRAAVASDDPVMIMESRRLYPSKGQVELGGPVPEVGGCRLVRPGEHFTLVTWSTMVGPATVAVESLVEAGLSGEVLDARWLAPLDVDAILGSVADKATRCRTRIKPNRGFGGEIVATVAEHLGGELYRLRSGSERPIYGAGRPGAFLRPAAGRGDDRREAAAVARDKMIRRAAAGRKPEAEGRNDDL